MRRFALKRATPHDDEDALELSQAHAAIALPRHGRISWDSFDRTAYTESALAAAAEAWQTRATQEYGSLALFTELASHVHKLGAPLDWSGAFARMIGDEVRHTELCARFAETCDPRARVEIDPQTLSIPVVAPSLRAHVRGAIVAAFCIGETLSGRTFRRCLRAATVPLARDVVRTICDDETFHGRFGWEAAALMMRADGPDFEPERSALAKQLPDIFAHYRDACGAERGKAWATGAHEATEAPNFGTLTDKAYARVFFEGMEEDVVPGLVAIGFPEATAAWASLNGP